MNQKAYGWAAVIALVLTPCSRPCAAAERRNHFSDVPLHHWAYDAVNELADLGILVGYPPVSGKVAPAEANPEGQRSSVQPRRARGSSPRRPVPTKGKAGAHLSPSR